MSDCDPLHEYACAQCALDLQGPCAADPTFGLCLGCHAARYCSPACQRDAWCVVCHIAVKAVKYKKTDNAENYRFYFNFSYQQYFTAKLQAGPQAGLQKGPQGPRGRHEKRRCRHFRG